MLQRYLKNKKKPFKLKKTLYTIECESLYGVTKWISAESVINKKELFFIPMVNKAMEKFDWRSYPEININEIRYFNLPEKKFTKTNCYEVDIKGAYWHFAKEFLPKEIYERGLKVDKKTRLAALGSLAKTVTHMNFDGEEFDRPETITDERRNLFFHCAKKTSEVIEEIFMLIDSGIFFWVDAVFIKNKKDLQYIEYVMRKHGLEYSIYFCEKIVSTDLMMKVYSVQHRTEKNKKESFRAFHKQKKNSSFFINKLLNEKKHKQ